MAGFGGSVKLTGANEYKNALKDITQNLKILSAEMKATSSGFEAGEKSEKEMIASSKEMKKALDEQKQALADLKNKLPDLISQYDNAKKKHKELSSELAVEKKTLEEVEKAFGKSSKEYEDQKKVVDDLTKEVDKSGKEYQKLGKDVDDATLQIAKTETTINQTSVALDKMGESAEESGKDAEKGSEGYTVMKNVLANLASEAISAAIDGLKQLGAKFVEIGKEAVDSYAEFEQLQGGVEKLFGEDVAQTVGENAQKAFQTAGMSANEYMETVTGFSASLINSLGGDTELAATFADQAIRDMSDNANVFGSNMESIQAAYSGFSRGQFQMLDSLKLGYGGTKEEMERLLKDAAELEGYELDAFDVNNFADIVDAIHIVQENMNITGTTAKEASGTIQGSTDSMKAAWQNMLTGMADENSDFQSLASNFIGTLITPDGKGGVIGTVVPRITQVIKGMSEAIQTTLPELINQIIPIISENLPIILESVGSAAMTLLQTVVEVLGSQAPMLLESGWTLLTNIVDGILNSIPELETSLPTVIDSIVTTLANGASKMISAGIELLKKLINGIKTAIPVLVKMLPTIIKQTASTLMSLLPEIVKTGTELLTALIDGIVETIPQLVAMLPEIITTIIDVLTDNLPLIVQAGITLLTSLIKGIVEAIPQLVKEIPKIIKAIKDTLTENMPKIIEAGKQIITDLGKGIVNNLSLIGEKAAELAKTIFDKLGEGLKDIATIGGNLVEGIWNGIKDKVAWITEKIKGFGESVKESVKKAFGIASPSKVMRDEVGRFLAEGIGEGFTQEMKAVSQDMIKAVPTDFGVANGSMGATGGIGAAYAYDAMVNAFKDALYQVKIEMDDVAMGHFIDKTMTSLVYT